MPVTRPLKEPMRATNGFPLVQAPPGTALVKVMVFNTHAADDPDIAAGAGLTVTTIVTLHVVGSE